MIPRSTTRRQVPGTIPIAVPEHDDEPVDPVEPVFDPLLTTAGKADNPTCPLDLPSTIGLSGLDRSDQTNGPAPCAAGRAANVVQSSR